MSPTYFAEISFMFHVYVLFLFFYLAFILFVYLSLSLSLPITVLWNICPCFIIFFETLPNKLLCHAE